MRTSYDQNSESFITLVNRASPEALSAACIQEEDEGLSTFYVIAHYQTHEGMQALLQRLPPFNKEY